MEELNARIPSRIILNGSSSISLSERFRQLKQVPKSSNRNRMAGLREPRSFLYDDYHMEDDSYGRRNAYSESRNDFAIGGSGARGASMRRRDFDDVGLDELAAHLPRSGARHRDLDAFVGGSGTGHARRFADAMGIQSNRSQRVYDDLDYGAAPRSRMVYREAPAPRVRQQVVRRVGGGRNYFDDSREVVEVIQRVRRPQHRVQVVRKVPIHQRVVKKVIVKKSIRTQGGNRRGNNNKTGSLNTRVQRRGNTGGVQKKTLGGGARPNRPKRDNKPKLSASELDRELEVYMKGGKHPRVEL